MKQLKRMLAAILAVTMVVGMMPITGFATVRDVGLYWSYYEGVEDGETQYDTSFAEPFMWDEIGQDIRSVFLFWDGSAFSVVPFEELTFPVGLTYTRLDDADAVYMVFDTPINVTIDYTVGGITYKFPLEVVDPNTQLADGLYACAADVDENDKIVPITTRLCNPENVRTQLNGTAYRAFYLVRNGVAEQLMLEDLICDDPDRMQISILERNDVSEDGIFEVQYLAYGSTSVSCKRDGVTYTLPVEVKLDSVSFFNEPVRSVATYAGDAILFDEDSSGVETRYMIVEEGWEITDILFDEGQPDFFSYSLENGYAVVTVRESFETQFYTCTVNAVKSDDPNQTNEWWFGFWVKNECADDEQSGGLYWCYGNEMEDLAAELNWEIMSEGTTQGIHIYFEENDEYIQLDGNSGLTASEELVFRWKDKAGCFSLGTPVAGSYEITYIRDGKTYTLPVTVKAAESEALKDGLYWSKYEDGSYNPDDVADYMYDIIDQDICAMFLFWDGDSFAEVPYDDLVFPEGLNHSRVDESNAVYMMFDTPMNVNIDYIVDGVTYHFPLTVEDPAANRAVGLYWSSIWGWNQDGSPIYNTTNPKDYMRDEVGQDIDAMFLFWDGTTFVEIPHDQLTFPDNVVHSVSTEYEKAVYMQFNTAVKDDITCTVDGVTYRFSLEVEDKGQPELETGLYWCWVDNPDNILEPEAEDMCSEMDRSVHLDTSILAVFYFVDGDRMTQLMWDDLGWSGLIDLELLEENDQKKDGVFSVLFKKYGTGEITYKADDGIVYRLPVTIELPSAAYYTAPERTEANYAGFELVFDGKDEEGNPATEETFYLMLGDGWKVTNIELHDDDMDFYTWKIPAGENYAIVTIAEEFTDEYYDVMVYGQRIDDPKENGDWWADFEMKDTRPGLKWCGIDDSNGSLIPETYNMSSRFDVSAHLGSTTNVAFYFVDGDEMTRLMWDDLSWDDDYLKLVTMEEAGTKKDGFFYVNFNAFGSSEITYEAADGIVYRLPVTIELPSAAYYTAPERTEANYAGFELVFDGKDEEGNPATEETFYLMLEEGWKVTGIDLHTYGMESFYKYDEIETAQDYVVITIEEGFDTEQRYEVLVHGKNEYDGENGWWADFDVKDARPGLKWCHDGSIEDVLNGDLNALSSSLNEEVYDRGNWDGMAFWFAENGEVTQLSNTSGLVFGEGITAEWQQEGYYNVQLTKVGKTSVTYVKDGVTYTLPVTVELPWLGIYSSSTPSAETFLGYTMTFKDTTTPVYLCLNPERVAEGYTMGDLKRFPDWLTAEKTEDGAGLMITMKESGLENGSCNIKVELLQNGKPNGSAGRSFDIMDARPSLKWCWSGSIEDVENGNYNELSSLVDVAINERNHSYDMAFWFVDGDNVTKLGKDADLDFGNSITANWHTGSGCFEVNFPAFGEYDIVYTDDEGNEYALPVMVTLPQLGFYSEPEASEEVYLGTELILRGDPTTVYLVCDSEWITITKLEPDTRDGEDMSFLDWDISKDGRYITLEISKEVRADNQYGLEVHYVMNDGETGSTWMSFAVQKKDPGLIWNPVKEDGQGGYIVTDQNVHRDTMTLTPGDSFLLQVRYFDSANYTVLDLADLDLPDFVTVETVDADNAILRITCNSLGIGTITCDTWEGCNIRVTAQTAGVLDFYTQPECNAAYQNRSFNGENGEIVTRYLMWDQTLLPGVDKVTVSLRDGETGDYVLEEEDITTTGLAPWGIELTSALDEGYVKVDATITTWRNVKFTLWQNGAIGAETSVNINDDYDDWDWKTSSDFMWHDGTGEVEIGIGMGEVEVDGTRITMRGGMGFSGDGEFSHQMVLCAMANMWTDAECEAPDEIYAAISNVKFFVRKWVNTDGSGDQSTSNMRLGEVYTIKVNGKQMYAVDLLADVGKYAYVEIGATFTVTLDGVTTEHFIYDTFFSRPNTEYEIDMSELDTAEKLNAVLASTEDLEAWLQEHYPEELEGFYTALQQGEFANFQLCLPPVQYDGIIEYGITGLEGPDMCGTEDAEGNRTTMPGLWLRGNDCFFLSDIDFVADDRYQMAMGEETFTCGILSCGIGTGDADIGDIFDADNCTFTGFDYGVWCTPTGYTIIRNSIFTDCGVGYLIDCEGKDHGNANSIVDNNRFVYCGVGLWVKGLPEYITPYDFRVINNDFLSCDVDIDASQPGRLYFFRNYFGKVKGENKHEIPVVADDVHKHAPRVRGRGLATIVASPRWRDPVTFELDREDNHLIVDNKHGLVTYIPADEAAELLLSAAAMEIELNAATNPVEISIVEPGDEGDTLGTWTFPVAQTTTFGLMSGTATDFSAALDISWLDGVQYITVQDSTLLYSRKPTLTVPCSWVDAVVTFNGVPVDSTIVGGKITFTVAAGGTYRIEEVAMTDSSFVTGNNAELTEEDAVISWYDRSEEGAEAPDFLQRGSETIFVEDEMDAEAEGEKYDENAVTETTLLTVEASFKAPVDETVVVLLVLYDENGRMLSMAQQEATQNSGTGTIVVKCDEKLIKTDSVMVKAFVINADGSMTPLSAVPFSQTLNLKAE